MSVSANRKLIEDHFDAKTQRNEPVLRAQLTDAVRWWTPQTTEARGVKRPFVGPDEVVALLMSLGFYKPEGRVWTMHHIIADEDAVAAHVTLTTETVNGHPYVNNYVFIFEIRDGRIDQVWEHLDTAYTYALLDDA